MLRPDGSPEYARVTGMNRYTSTLVPNGWPAFGGGQVFGLNPDARYNVGGGIYTPAKIRVTALTNDVKITRYYETPTHIVMNLESAGASSATFTWQTNGVTVYKTLRNGVGTSSPGSTPKNVIAALPSRYVLITVPLNQVDAPVFSDPDFGSTMTRQLGNRCTDSGRFIEEETGIDRGGELPAVHRDTHWWWANPDPLISNLSTLMPAWGENAPQTFDYLAKVPTPSTPALKHTVLQVFTCHVCGDTSDLVVHLNGQEVARLSGTAVCDPGPVSTCGTQSCASTDPCPSCAVPGSGDCSPGAVMCHPCIPPGRYELDMTAYHGKEVVISVSMDHGSDNNPDGDGRWISRPRFAEATNSQ